MVRSFALIPFALVAVLACGSESPPSTSSAGSANAPTSGSGNAAAGGGTGGSAGSPSFGGSVSVAGAGGNLAFGGAGGAPGAGGAGAPSQAGASGASTGGTGGVAGMTTQDPGTEGDGDFTINPPYKAAPESTVAGGVPRGMRQRFTLSSSVSAIYPTDVASGKAFDRQLEVYIPSGYVQGTEAPFMVVQDGSGYVGRLAPVLDNMINDGRLPRMIGIFINPGPGDGPGSERGLEYDTVSDAYVNFIETEILPKVTADYGVRFTTNPEGRASFGCSSGGAAAFTMGWFRPNLYRRILTYSGTFTNQHSDAMNPHGAWGYHETLIPGTDAKPLRVFLEVGQNDNGSTAPATGFRNWVLANQGMARELKAKGYHYRFVFANGAGHCDSNVISQTLPETMLWLWRGYPR